MSLCVSIRFFGWPQMICPSLKRNVVATDDYDAPFLKNNDNVLYNTIRQISNIFI
jgi:hypothetical protein